MSKDNVKSNRLGSTKLTNHQERNFPRNYLIFFENFVYVSEQRVVLM